MQQQIYQKLHSALYIFPSKFSSSLSYLYLLRDKYESYMNHSYLLRAVLTNRINKAAAKESRALGPSPRKRQNIYAKEKCLKTPTPNTN